MSLTSGLKQAVEMMQEAKWRKAFYCKGLCGPSAKRPKKSALTDDHALSTAVWLCLDLRGYEEFL
jgi:hypothetical protein